MVWVIILSTSADEFYAYSEMFDEMVNSFKIEMKPNSVWSDLEQAGIGIGLAALAGGAAGTIVWLTRKRRGPVAPKQT
jgi:ABC-type transport system involved in cytochrome c biogenesis permease subunit